MLNVWHFKVGYSDTDQMGVMHHSNYLRYYESARHDFFCKQGVSYPEIETSGIFLPVVKISVDYIKPALFDEQIRVETRLTSFKGPRMLFSARMINDNYQTVSTCRVMLAWVDRESRKPCLPNKLIRKLIGKYEKETQIQIIKP